MGRDDEDVVRSDALRVLVGRREGVFTEADPVSMAKALTDFAKEREGKLEVCAGILEGKLLTKEEVQSLAKTPSREVLLTRLVCSLQSPYACLVYTLSGVLRKLVYALDAIRREKEQGADK